MKNIINIDTFFYDPAKHKLEQEKQKKDEAARKKKEAEDRKYLQMKEQIEKEAAEKTVEAMMIGLDDEVPAEL